jgi:hypothetical protein
VWDPFKAFIEVLNGSGPPPLEVEEESRRCLYYYSPMLLIFLWGSRGLKKQDRAVSLPNGTFQHRQELGLLHHHIHSVNVNTNTKVLLGFECIAGCTVKEIEIEDICNLESRH